MDNRLDTLLFGNSQGSQPVQSSPQIQSTQSTNKQDLDSILFNPVQTTNATSQFDIPTNNVEKSAVGIIDRLAMGFGNETGNENYLKQRFPVVQKIPGAPNKFMVGNDSQNLIPVDPDGFFNDALGELADAVGYMPEIAGQILGGMIGSPGGAAGVIVGGSAGSGVGKAVQIGVGEALGTREQKAMDAATDVLISSAYGAAGEALVIGGGAMVKGAGKLFGGKSARLLDTLAKNSAVSEGVDAGSSSFTKGLAKTFKVLANVPEDSTETVMKYGVLDTFNNPANLDKRSVLKHIDTVIDAVKGTQKELGARVGASKDAFVRVTGSLGKEVKVGDIAEYVVKEAQDLGIIDDFGNFVSKANIANSKDVGPIRQLLHNIATVDKSRVVIDAEKTISGKDALRVSKIFGDAYEGMSQNAQNIINVALGNNEAAGFTGLRTRIRDLASEVGLKDFATIMDDFGSFMNLKEQLTQLRRFKPDKIENFIKKLENLGEWNKTVLSRLNRFVESTGSNGFIKHIEQWNAAQDFIGTSPNLLRFGAIGGILAGLTGFQTKESKMGTLAGAMLLGTPTGLRVLIKTAANTGKIPKSIVSSIGKDLYSKIGTRTIPTTISQLMRMSKKK